MSAVAKSSGGKSVLRNLPSNRFTEKIDGFLQATGRAISWLWIVIIVVIAITIIVRYGATKLGIQAESYWGSRILSSVFWEELSWYIYGYAWLLALCFALVNNDHVRVDILHERVGPKVKVWIEVMGFLFFFIPTFVAITCHGLDFAIGSFLDGEGSQQVGLDFRWIAKFSIFITSILLVLAGISRLVKCFKWIWENSGKLAGLLLLLFQFLGAMYLLVVIYFMFTWSSDNSELMYIFRIFGLQVTGE